MRYLHNWMKTQSLPSDTLIFTRALMRSEEERSEKLVAVVRSLLAILVFGIALSIRGEVPEQSFQAILGSGLLAVLYSYGVVRTIRRKGYNPGIKYKSTTFDILLLTFALIVFGGFRTFKAEAFLLYFLWITLAALRFSYPLTIYAGVISCVSYVLVIAQALVLGTIELGTITESYVSQKVSVGNLGIRMAFLGAFSLFAIYITRVSHDLMVNIAIHKRTADQEHHEKLRMQTTLSQYVAPEVAEKILTAREGHHGERKKATLLFCDVRDFTRLSEQTDPAELMTVLNDYFIRLIDVVNEHGGILNKFTGDGFLAMYGVPRETGFAEEMAVRSAVRIHQVVTELNESRQRQGLISLRFGIGIHTGEVIAGDLGSEKRKEYTVIGNAVNLASRVEGLNKQFGTDILITEETWAYVRDLVKVRAQPRIRVKGVDRAIQTYSVIGFHSTEERDRLAREPQLEPVANGTVIGAMVRRLDSLIHKIRSE